MTQLVVGLMNIAGTAGAQNYFAAVDGGLIQYQFSGDTLDEQVQNLQMFAQYMNDGQDAMIANINQVLELGDTTINGAIDELFVANNELAYAGEVLALAAEDTIWTEIVECGVWLLGLVMGA